MGRRRKEYSEPAQIRFIVAYNVKILRDEVYGSEINETKRNRKLARVTNTSLSQIQRICRAELSVGVDIIERMARALKCAPADLLTPYFALRRKDPGATDPLSSTGTERLLKFPPSNRGGPKS